MLEDVGWIDRSVSVAGADPSNGKIWKEWNASDAFLGNRNSPPLERIPSDAQFLIDGNGLAFYLHSIAYARYVGSLEIKGSSNGNNNNANGNSNGRKAFRCPTTNDIMADQKATTLALPCMLPLSILRGVTKEFVAGLKHHVREIKVFWDGPSRQRFKAKADQQRQLERDRQESYLELYCNHGTMITAGKKRNRNNKNLKYVYEWKEVFPFSKLFGTCVRHALLEEGGGRIEMIECREEADVELAKHASGDSRAFVVGLDSDFFFYKDIQYIPLTQVALLPSGGVHAFVARRSDLARLLGFDHNDDGRLIDLALLMGNDYVDPFLSLDVPEAINLSNVQSMVYYLQCHEDFRATAKNDEGKAAVDFVRSLYNLHSIEAFPLDVNPSFLQDDDEDQLDGILHAQTEEAEAGMLLHETMVRYGILRYLQSTLDRAGADDENFPLTEEALRAFELSSTPIGRESIPDLDIRPSYRDMKAAKFIERCISRVYRRSQDSLLIRTTPPELFMSRIHFHAALASLRAQSIETEVAQDGESVSEERIIESEPITESIRLPIDEHEEAILENIRNHRVTIIHGETGCGKSSRVPVMLLKSPPPDGSLRKVRFFISQPRRIAAKALVERVRSCEPELRDKFALRMGHGWREYETKDTQAHFVTTGYLVRLLANHPERFENNTHLVIDEVHERSVDTDILCLLCRRLLETNKTIRLVLMSATLATKMYRDYFNVPNEPIHVGVRKYPITEYFVEDLAYFGLPQQEAKAALSIQKENETKFCISAPSANEMKNRFALAARLATIVGEPGSSVLIFVPGMGEIIAISECIESYHKAGINYTCFPIHSDIPFEEQMDAFLAPGENEVKIIIATNAAESSVTLPNVDHVICLGLCRQIVYNQSSHRQMLTSAWISRASATQRAGRTGRVRPGNVYRLYTKNAFDTCMEEFEPGEMVRIPLDSIILMLKQILHEEIKPVFLDCLEPPALDTIDRSFQSLYYWNFITEASDKANITPLGSFVSALGIDLSLGSFIGIGIQFGVAAEAIEMAAMMSLHKTPFQITSPMWLTPGKFNESASKTYSSKCKFDAGLYSEPMGLMNALWDYVSDGASRKNNWCYKNSFAVKRWQQVISSRNSLRKRVAEFLGIHEEKLQVQLPPRDMPHEKVSILRILKVWVFSDSILECSPSKLQLSHDGSVALSVMGKSSINLEESHFDKILQPERHPFCIVERNETEQTGVFQEEGPFSFSDFVDGFESRLLSYASEMNIEASLCYSDEELYLYFDKSNASGVQLLGYLETIAAVSRRQDRFAYDFTNKKRRGIQERASGIWTVVDTPCVDAAFARQKEFLRIELNQNEAGGEFKNTLASIIHEVFGCDLKSKMIWHFFTQKKNKKKKKKTSSSQPFWVTTIGQCRTVSSIDFEDLLGRKPLSVSTNKKKSGQSIILRQPPEAQQPEIIGFREPLFADVPEGARILAMLASSQRKGQKHVLKIPIDSENMDSEDTYNFAMKKEEIDVSMRWRRLDTSNPVYVDESVPGTAIHTTNNLFAVAANGLELRSGGLRVEGLTLLPPNPLFLLLSHLSFGLEISTPLLWALASNGETCTDKKKISKAYSWLVNRAMKVSKTNTTGRDQIILSMPPVTDNTSSQPQVWQEEELKNRLEQATAFNKNSLQMEEKLVCFPEKIRELCELFDGVDGHNLLPWESIDEESLTAENLKKWQWERKSSTNEGHPRYSRQFPSGATNQAAPPGVARNSDRTECRGTPMKSLKKNHLEHHAIRHFDNQLIASSKKWFATTLTEGNDMPAFPSTNILALLFQQFEEVVRSEDNKGNNKRNFKVALDTENWDIACFKGKDDRSIYKARFLNDSIAMVPVFGRGKNKLPKWIKKNRGRPSTIAEARKCVPPNVVCPTPVESGRDGLLFGSIEDAMKMEAAFWLSLQFYQAGKTWIRHWYAYTMGQMIETLRKHANN